MRFILGDSAKRYPQGTGTDRGMVGASGASIHRWEQGKSHPRQAQVGRLVAVRRLGKREALKRLELLGKK